MAATSLSYGRVASALAPIRPFFNATWLKQDDGEYDICWPRPVGSFLCMDGGFRVIAKVSCVSMVDVLAVYNTC